MDLTPSRWTLQVSRHGCRAPVYQDWTPALIHVTLNVRDLAVGDFRRRESPGAAEASTLLVANGRPNTVDGEDGRRQQVREFAIRRGNIKELWLNQ